MMGKREEMDALERLISNCRRCPLHASRRRAVPGEGNLEARVMLVGEAPGEREDEEGRPFVGQAGRLLNEVLSGLGVDRGEIYITNVVKCRPPNNRDPEDAEVEACRPYLERQIQIVAPRVVVALGRHSARLLLGYGGVRFRGIMQVRGRTYRVRISGVDVEVVPTIHPAAALYNPRNRPMLVEDLRRALGRRDADITGFL